MAVLESLQSGAPDRADGFELAYVTRDGTPARVALGDAGPLPLERAAPVLFASYKGQCHLPGRWWSATDQRHVGYESWLERDHLAAFDFNPPVMAIASQPFWLLWMTGEGKSDAGAEWPFDAGRVSLVRMDEDQAQQCVVHVLRLR